MLQLTVAKPRRLLSTNIGAEKKTMLVVTVALVMAVVLWGRSDAGTFRQAFWRFPGGNNRAMAFLIFVALLIVLNPEMRLLLLFIDAVGIDVLLLLILCQLQGCIAWVQQFWLPTFGRTFRNWGPLPFSVPTPVLFRKHPVLSVCSISGPIAALGFIGALAFLIYINAMTLLHVYA
jgi:hypothetical protein